MAHHKSPLLCSQPRASPRARRAVLSAPVGWDRVIDCHCIAHGTGPQRPSGTPALTQETVQHEIQKSEKNRYMKAVLSLCRTPSTTPPFRAPLRSACSANMPCGACGRSAAVAVQGEVVVEENVPLVELAASGFQPRRRLPHKQREEAVCRPRLPAESGGGDHILKGTAAARSAEK